jgi:hypothetical protein
VAAGRLPYLSRRPAFARPSSENGGDGAALSPPSPKPLEKAPNGKEGEALSAPRQLVRDASRNRNRRITLPRQCPRGTGRAAVKSDGSAAVRPKERRLQVSVKWVRPDDSRP